MIMIMMILMMEYMKEDPWLKLNELYNSNALIDEFLDKI